MTRMKKMARTKQSININIFIVEIITIFFALTSLFAVCPKLLPLLSWSVDRPRDGGGGGTPQGESKL
jgi:hypothetical protein